MTSTYQNAQALFVSAAASGLVSIMISTMLLFSFGTDQNSLVATRKEMVLAWSPVVLLDWSIVGFLAGFFVWYRGSEAGAYSSHNSSTGVLGLHQDQVQQSSGNYDEAKEMPNNITGISTPSHVSSSLSGLLELPWGWRSVVMLVYLMLLGIFALLVSYRTWRVVTRKLDGCGQNEQELEAQDWVSVDGREGKACVLYMGDSLEIRPGGAGADGVVVRNTRNTRNMSGGGGEGGVGGDCSGVGGRVDGGLRMGSGGFAKRIRGE